MTYLEEYFGLQDKVAMVTGGNTGIGMAIAIELAKAGADLFITTHSDRDNSELEKTVAELGRKIVFYQCNLAKEEIAASAADKCVEAYGKIDILINNAGMIHRAPLLEGDNDGWKKVLDLNLNAVYYLSKNAATHMAKKGSGKIINIASMLSFQGGKFVPSYTSSKHGVAGLTKAFANELAEKGININAIAPGYIETANTAPIRADKERNQSILDRIPAGRWGQTSDLAGAAVFLSAKASDYMNGHVLCVDGGWLVR